VDFGFERIEKRKKKREKLPRFARLRKTAIKELSEQRKV
jgi:hypothetical protein